MGRLPRAGPKSRVVGRCEQCERRNYWKRWGLRGNWHVLVAIFPVANNNVLRSRARWPTIHVLSWPTNRQETSTKNSQRAFEMLKTIVQQKQMALLLVTHNPAIAEACDWIHEMKDGRIIATCARGSG